MRYIAYVCHVQQSHSLPMGIFIANALDKTIRVVVA